MKVKDLKERLQNLPDDMVVIVPYIDPFGYSEQAYGNEQTYIPVHTVYEEEKVKRNGVYWTYLGKDTSEEVLVIK